MERLWKGEWRQGCLVGGLLALLMLILPATVGAVEMPGAHSDATTDDSETNPDSSATQMILGLSWQPGFCEGRSNLPECTGQSADDLSARQFSLNGLWRLRKTYCGVPDALWDQDKKRKWLDMPELSLDAGLKAELAKAMPGTASGLERHEWIKHGTCSGDVAARYYSRSLKMLSEVNGSAVGQLFSASVGKTLRQADIQALLKPPSARERVTR